MMTTMIVKPMVNTATNATDNEMIVVFVLLFEGWNPGIVVDTGNGISVVEVKNNYKLLNGFFT